MWCYVTLNSVGLMPSPTTATPTCTDLLELLLQSGLETVKLTHVNTTPAAQLNVVTERLDLALGHAPAVYATHGFKLHGTSGQLEGRVHVFTGSHVASANVDGPNFVITVVPLTAISAIVVRVDGDRCFSGSTTWEGLGLELTLDGQGHKPRNPESSAGELNARAFEAMYSRLLAVMRTR